jgi:ATP/maltotriose-dependent transcriptional regulator MalT
LKFSVAETEALASARGVRLDQARVRQLCEACEGWAAGLSLTMSAGAPAAAPRAGSQPALVAYLVDQIISELPQRLTDFLERTSVLESLNVAFLARHGAIPDAIDMMRDLERRGAMLTALERDRT